MAESATKETSQATTTPNHEEDVMRKNNEKERENIAAPPSMSNILHSTFGMDSKDIAYPLTDSNVSKFCAVTQRNRSLSKLFIPLESRPGFGIRGAITGSIEARSDKEAGIISNP